MSTPEFFRSRLDAMIDLQHPLAAPPRQNSCRLHRPTPGAAMKNGLGSIRTGIQGQGGKDGEARPTHREQPTAKHWWRTRVDPFADAWPVVEGWSVAEPAVSAKTLMERLATMIPDAHQHIAAGRAAVGRPSVPIRGRCGPPAAHPGGRHPRAGTGTRPRIRQRTRQRRAGRPGLPADPGRTAHVHGAAVAPDRPTVETGRLGNRADHACRTRAVGPPAVASRGHRAAGAAGAAPGVEHRTRRP